MTCLDVPDWCEHGSGERPLLILAPHGGRRQVEPRGDASRKVNDLHTADLARELADALRASYLINPCSDRNQLDLNRIGQVRARAPWFLALLEHLLGELLLCHARVDLLVIHGWNITQPKCDLGVGRRLDGPADARERADELTVSPGYVAHRLAGLREACAARGISTLFGERYPARHPNNVLQLFRRAPRPGALAPQLASWASENRVDAVQLELGIPLRWPGPLRRAFLSAAQDAFRSPLPEPAHAERPASPARQELAEVRNTAALRPSSTPISATDQPAALQCYDAAAELGVIARVETTAAGVSGRLLLFVERRLVCLFTGEEASRARLGGGGPHFSRETDGFRLAFRGHVLATGDGDRYVDIEDAFASSVLCAVEVDLRFRALATPDLGAVSGTVAIDGTTRRVDALGLGRPELLRRSGAAWRSQLRIAAALAPDHGLRVSHEFPGPGASREDLTPNARNIRPVAPVVVHFHPDASSPARILAGCIAAEPIARMTIVRPAGARQHARVSFGIARVSDGPARGFGFYEYGRVL